MASCVVLLKLHLHGMLNPDHNPDWLNLDGMYTVRIGLGSNPTLGVD